MAKLPSNMSHSFSQVPRADIPRSSFNRSSGYKTTFDAGYLVPVFLDEALPGDTFNLKMTAFCRLNTPINPIMDNLFLDSFFFAVPVRLLWDNWQKFNGEQLNPDDSTDYVTPTLSSLIGGFDVGSLGDYFGLPTGEDISGINSLPFRAYNLIYNEWFRDENLQDSVVVDKGDGPDDPADYQLLRRGKRHDYFTSALPWPQKGPAVSLPLSGDAPVISTGGEIEFSQGAAYTDRKLHFNVYNSGSGPAGVTPMNSTAYVAGDPNGLRFGTQTGLEADLSDIAAFTINALREAFQIQRLLERDARGGTRYTEIVKSHFGVTSPDSRLQRPEYLGGGSSPVTITPVSQTSSTDTTSPQGNLSGFGTSSLVGHGFTKSFTEHCVIIGMVSARADLTYQHGIDRMWSRRTRWDYYWPALSHLGEQTILNQEIYFSGDPNIDSQVFGYQERYAEYRYKNSLVTGQFRSSYAQSLDTWHLAQDFASTPALNAEFIVENPPVERISAVPDRPDFLFDSFFDLKCARPMPVYSIPGFIDHF